MYFNIDHKQSNTAMLKFLQADIFWNVLKVYSQKTNLINRFILQKKACITSMLSNILIPKWAKKNSNSLTIGQKVTKNDCIILNHSEVKLYSYYIIYMETYRQPLPLPLSPPSTKKTLAKYLISNGIVYQESACTVVF